MTVGERPDPRSCGTRDGMPLALPPDVVARICNRPTTTQGGRSMNFIIWLIVGGLIGWIASIVMRHPEGVLMDVVDGMRVARPPDVVARVCNWTTTTQGGRSMNFIIWLIVGGLIGWIASIVMRHPEGVLM